MNSGHTSEVIYRTIVIEAKIYFRGIPYYSQGIYLLGEDFVLACIYRLRRRKHIHF